MRVRSWLAAVLAVAGVAWAEGTASAQGCGPGGGGGSRQMQGGPSGGGQREMRGGPNQGGPREMRGGPNTGGYSQLVAQQQAYQAQLLAYQLSTAADSGYSNYAKMYAAQQKRLAEQRELRAER